MALALLVLWLGGARAERAFPLTFYLLGALIVGGAFFSSAADMGSDYYYDVGERESRVSSVFAFVPIGLALIGIGALVDASL